MALHESHRIRCHAVCCHLQGVLQALLGSTKGVSSAARRFRLRCLKAVILLLDSHPELDFDLDSSEAADATAMLSPQEKRQQVCVKVLLTASSCVTKSFQASTSLQHAQYSLCLSATNAIQS